MARGSMDENRIIIQEDGLIGQYLFSLRGLMGVDVLDSPIFLFQYEIGKEQALFAGIAMNQLIQGDAPQYLPISVQTDNVGDILGSVTSVFPVQNMCHRRSVVADKKIAFRQTFWDGVQKSGIFFVIYVGSPPARLLNWRVGESDGFVVLVLRIDRYDMSIAGNRDGLDRFAEQQKEAEKDSHRQCNELVHFVFSHNADRLWLQNYINSHR